MESIHANGSILGAHPTGDPVDVLRAARDTLSDPARWTRGAYACDAAGHDVGVLSRKAACWCGSGALSLHGADADGPETGLLRVAARELFGVTPVLVNDRLGHAAVLRMYDRAIELVTRHRHHGIVSVGEGFIPRQPRGG